jgi:hypothetical protein
MQFIIDTDVCHNSLRLVRCVSRVGTLEMPASSHYLCSQHPFCVMTKLMQVTHINNTLPQVHT